MWLKHLVSPQKQAVESLQSEEEKVNLLTKDKTKLLMFYLLYTIFFFFFRTNQYIMCLNCV